MQDENTIKKEDLQVLYPEKINPQEITDADVLKVNNHLHTPYSFSAFRDIPQLFEMAIKENVRVLGITDFYSTDGYSEFLKTAIQRRVFPLLNIEFIGLARELQKKEVKVNDPSNPGRIYFSGKGLQYPFYLSEDLEKSLENVRMESQRQIKMMIDRLNEHFSRQGIRLVMDYPEVREKFAHDLVRDRHLAKAINEGIQSNWGADANLLREKFKVLFSGEEPVQDLDDPASIENQIRSLLLKKGGPAFVPEDEGAFLPVETIISIVREAGGIPCYPVLLDDKNGKYTGFEKNWDQMHQILQNWKVNSVELIPVRNSLEELEKFVRFFTERDYLVTFGTEHNATGLAPVTVTCRNNTELTNYLKKVNYSGACAIAAHQYFSYYGEEGLIDENGRFRKEELNSFMELGNALIQQFVK